MRPIKTLLWQAMCFLLLCFLGTTSLTAQTLNKPVPGINDGAPSEWDRICAKSDYNDYHVTFKWGPPLVNSGNTFILELSDANGSFASPVQVASESGMNTNFEFDFIFSLPTTIRGDGYKLRVRSTSPAKTSPESDAFAMYYIDYNSPLLISKDGNGTIPPGGQIQVCDGNSVTLAPHNIANPETYQYNWYRSGTLLAQKGPSLTTSTAGTYSVEIDYGDACSGSGNTLSNNIQITTGTSIGIAINTPSKTALCPTDTETLQASVSGMGYTYTWYKDGTAVTGAVVNGDTYVVDGSNPSFEGAYTVEIYGTGVCLEESAPVTMSNADTFTVALDQGTDLVLLPGQTGTLSVTTNANAPAYQWYRNGSAMGGETNSTLSINQEGDYYVAVTQTGGSCAATTKNSGVTTVALPASFEIGIDHASAYTDCSSTSTNLEVSSILAVDGSGNKTDVTSQMLSQFSYQWKKDGVSVPSGTNSSIALTTPAENGAYSLTATSGSFTPTSNVVPVQLLVNETLTITPTDTVFCSGGSITISTATDLSSASFSWTKDGAEVNTTDAVLGVAGPGSYQLTVDRYGCPLASNTVVISELDDSLVSLNVDSNLVIPEGSSKTVTASGATSYTWYDANNVVIGNSASIDLSLEGSYTVIAAVDNCTVTKTLTLSYLDTFKVPNVITPNGDGTNDQWVIPNKYSNKSEVNVTLYTSKGEEILNETSYKNDWPPSTYAFPQQNMVFFYTIREGGKTLKQGTITVIR